jgi:hypothetical protein
MKIENNNSFHRRISHPLSKAGSGAMETETSVDLDKLDPLQ